ncbi:MAG: T9SS type A sorting domain-containing protein [Bacteroidetes bacterium]|nr:T9SS type A sorting domain-containing protein [Bacteroidota bacterium]
MMRQMQIFKWNFLSDQQQTISATLINAQGAVIINKEIQSNQTYTFNSTQLPNGIYFFVFRNISGVYTKKIMIY